MVTYLRDLTSYLNYNFIHHLKTYMKINKCFKCLIKSYMWPVSNTISILGTILYS